MNRLPKLVPYAIFLAMSAAYACVVPLWQGTDEVGHFSYVQYIGEHGRLPDRESLISQEVVESVRLLPISYYVADVFGGWNGHAEFISFEEFNALSPEERSMRLASAALLPHALRKEPGVDNALYDDGAVPVASQLFYVQDILRSEGGMVRTTIWEAQQQPLYYLCLALVYKAFSFLGITGLVRILRFATALFFLPSVYFIRKFFLLFAPEKTADAAAFCVVFIPQLYIDVTHVSNDSLSIALACCAFYFLAKRLFSPGRFDLSYAGLGICLGMLTKITLIFLLPAYAIIALWLVARKRLNAKELRGSALGFMGTLALVAWKNRAYGSVVGLYGSQHPLREYLAAATKVDFLVLLRFVYNDFVGNLGWLNETYPGWLFPLVAAGSLGLAALSLALRYVRKAAPAKREHAVIGAAFALSAITLCGLIFAANLWYYVESGYATYVFYGGWYAWPLILPLAYAAYACAKTIVGERGTRAAFLAFAFLLSLLNTYTLHLLFEYYHQTSL